MSNHALAVVQAIVIVAGVAFGAQAAEASDPTCNSGWGWGSTSEVCHWSCHKSRQLTVYAEQSYEGYVEGKATCGGALAECTGIEMCGAHGTVTAYAEAYGHCEGKATINWWQYGRVRIWCDDTHTVSAAADATVAVRTLLAARDDWSCATLGELAVALPAGASVVTMRTDVWVGLNAEQQESRQATNLQGVFLKGNECHNFTPSVQFASLGQQATSLRLAIEPAGQAAR